MPQNDEPGEILDDRSLDNWVRYKQEMGVILKERNEDCENHWGSYMALRKQVRRALDELGVPSDPYPSPVANAVVILMAALLEGE